MPYKDLQQQRRAQAEYAQRRRDRTGNQERKDFRAKLKNIARQAKDVPCADCGQNYPYYVMDFDHRPGEAKIAEISVMIWKKGERALRAEIAKCDVVCSNCHRIRNHEREYKALCPSG